MIFPQHFINELKPEGSAPLMNPCRGWYQMQRLLLSPEDGDFGWFPPAYPLVLLEVNLKAYQNRDIDPKGAARLGSALQWLEVAGCQTILRLTYDWDGCCFETEPEDVAQIQAHMEQLADVLHAHEQSLFAVQGLLLGNWGEMHSSRHLFPSNLSLLCATLRECVPKSVSLAVRTPGFHRALCKGSEGLGIFDDALFSSQNDMGTFAPGSDWAAERAYCRAVAERAPVGGETAALHPANEGAAFITGLREMGLSYLNADYHPDVIRRWKETPYKGKGAFSGQSCYDAIGGLMGYRFVAQRVKARRDMLDITIRNTGSAPAYRPSDVSLVLSGEQTITLPIDTDIRAWKAETTLHVSTKGLPAGSYRCRLKLGSIALANEGAYRGFSEGNHLGVYIIRSREE